MHILILSQRNGRAQERMLAAAKAIARAAEIDPALVDALTSKAKDPAIRAMREREAVANLLEALAIRAGLMDPRDLEPAADESADQNVTTVTEPESKVMDESIPGPTPPDSAPAETGEKLPEPVLEEEPRAMGGLVDPGRLLYGEADQEETFVPAPRVAEEAPAEEPAVDKKPRGAKNRTSKK